MAGSLFHFAKAGDKLLLFAAVCGNLGSGAAYPIFLYLFGELANAMTGATANFHWTVYISFMALTAVADFVLATVGAGCAELAAERQTLNLSSIFLEKLMDQDIAYFDESDATTLSPKFEWDRRIVRSAIGQKFGLLFLYVGFVIAAIIYSFIKSASLTLFSLIPAPFILGSGIWAYKIESNANKARKAAFEKASNIAQESLSNIRTIKCFQLEGVFAQRFADAVNSAYETGRVGGFWSGLAQGLHWGLMFASFGLGFWWGVNKVADNMEADPEHCIPIFAADNDYKTDSSLCMTAGSVISVFWCIIGASFFLSKTTPSISLLSNARKAIKEFRSLYERPRIIDATAGIDYNLHEVNQIEIEFCNVNFSYPQRSHQTVFENLSFKIPAGHTVAIVGPSGSGKSTVVALLQRFYEVRSGSILVNGRPIQDYNIKYLRDHIAIVAQEPRLFAETIAANIAYGRPTADREDVIRAAKKANAHEFISNFPQGYDTYVGEGGFLMSGGQKQRIAIARALIRDPKVLILDEATSALDNESEKLVQEAINSVLHAPGDQRTVIIIAHRLSTVRDADRILVMGNPDGYGSRIVEQGSFSELVNMTDGLFAGMVATQTHRATPSPDAGKMIKRGSSRDARSRTTSRRTGLSMYAKISLHQSKGVDDVLELRDQDMRDKALYAELTKPLSNLKIVVGLGLVAAMVAGMVWPVFGICFAYFVNVFAYQIPDDMRRDAVKWGWGYFGLGVGAWLSLWGASAGVKWGGEAVIRHARLTLYNDHLLKQSCSFFDLPAHNSGVLVNYLASEVLTLHAWGGETVAVWLASYATLLLGLALSVTAHWKLGLVSLAGVFIMAPLSYMNSKLMKTGTLRRSRSAEKDSDVDVSPGFVTDVVLNIRVIKAYNLERIMSERFRVTVMADYIQGRRRALYTGLAWGLSQAFTLLTFTLCLWYGLRLVEERDADGRKVLQGVLCLLLAALNMGRGFAASNSSSVALQTARKMGDITDQEPEIEEFSPRGAQLTDIESLKFVNVAFAYPQRPDTPVYDDVSLDIPIGKTTALVGPSGCGKSTLTRLLLRFYDVDGGLIEINGHDMRDYNLQSVRQVISVVDQEPFLFWTSVEENILFGKLNATPEEIKEAARAANAEAFILDLPDQWQTDVGRGGRALSGGQKQRVALARSIIKRPQLLILDEATSALDAESERVTQKVLDDLIQSNQFTTVVIAHRLSTVRKADKIFVFDGGHEGSRIVEAGTHEELVQIPNGLYRGLIQIAQGG